MGILDTPGYSQAQADAKFAAAADSFSINRVRDLGVRDRQNSTADARIAYEDSGSFVETWADLTAWSANAVQVSAGRLYANSSTGATAGINHSWVLAAGEETRVVVDYQHIAGGSGGVMIGFSKDAAGAVPLTAGGNIRAFYFTGTSLYQYAGGTQGAAFTTALSGTTNWTITLSVDANYVMLSAVTADAGGLEYNLRYNRTGWPVNNIALFNSDARNLTGSSIGKVGARRSFATVTPRTGIEGARPTVVWTSIDTVIGARYALPAVYDSRKPLPVVMLFHGNGSDELHWVTNSNGKAVASAFLNAGYIVVSAANTANVSTWGAQAGLDAYFKAYKYLLAHFPVGSVVFYGNSMGGIESLLTLAERRIPCVAWIGTVPTANLAAQHANASFTSTIRTAYGIAADDSDYATKTAGHDPVLMPGYAFRGVPMWALIATGDTAVPPATNWDVFEDIVSPYAAEMVRLDFATSDHSTTQIASNTAAMVAFADKYAKIG